MTRSPARPRNWAEMHRAEIARLDQVRHFAHLGPAFQPGGEKCLGFIQRLGFDIQEKVARRAGRDDQLAWRLVFRNFRSPQKPGRG